MTSSPPPPSSSASAGPAFRVRLAQRSDAASILALIRGLAEFEKAPEEVTNTVERLQEDGWGPTPRFTVSDHSCGRTLTAPLRSAQQRH